VQHVVPVDPDGQHAAVVGTGQHGSASLRTVVIGPQQPGGPASWGQTIDARLCAVLPADALGASIAAGARPRTTDAMRTLIHCDTTFTALVYPNCPAFDTPPPAATMAARARAPTPSPQLRDDVPVGAALHQR
jgi:hypothetical protein